MTRVHSPSAHTQPGSAKTVADVLTAAADLIEPEGRWTQGVFRGGAREHPCWCVAGAVMHLATDALRWEALEALRCVVNERISTWNDNPARTQPEVVAALRAAAEKARAAA